MRKYQAKFLEGLNFFLKDIALNHFFVNWIGSPLWRLADCRQLEQWPRPCKDDASNIRHPSDVVTSKLHRNGTALKSPTKLLSKKKKIGYVLSAIRTQHLPTPIHNFSSDFGGSWTAKVVILYQSCSHGWDESIQFSSLEFFFAFIFRPKPETSAVPPVLEEFKLQGVVWLACGLNCRKLGQLEARRVGTKSQSLCKYMAALYSLSSASCFVTLDDTHLHRIVRSPRINIPDPRKHSKIAFVQT